MTLDRTVTPELAQSIVALVLGGGAADAGATGVGGDRTPLSVREFLVQHQAKRIPEQIACIGLYFKEHNKASVFAKKELVKAFEDAQEPVPKNLSRDIQWTVKNGWIAPKTGHKSAYYLTGTGETAAKANFPPDVREKTKQKASARRKRKKATPAAK